MLSAKAKHLRPDQNSRTDDSPQVESKKRPGGATGPDSENLEHIRVGCLSDEGVTLQNQTD